MGGGTIKSRGGGTPSVEVANSIRRASWSEFARPPKLHQMPEFSHRDACGFRDPEDVHATTFQCADEGANEDVTQGADAHG